MLQNDYIKKIAHIMENISIYDGVLNSGPSRALSEIIEVLIRTDVMSARLLAKLFKDLAAHAEFSPGPQVGSLWQNFLLEQIITDENTFTRMASGRRLARGGLPAEAVQKAAARELQLIRMLLDLDFRRLVPLDPDECIYPSLISIQTDNTPEEPQNECSLLIYRLKKELLDTTDWGSASERLSIFHRTSGYGIFCRYHAFRWDGKCKALAGIPDPDPVSMEDLVGYEEERGKVLLNTEQLIAGLPASNVLLYGDRGTGKSSTVKALLHKYGGRGLRIVEIPKKHLDDYPEIIASIKNTGLKFILFVDDLSFEDHETEYKQLKSILEGSLRARPANAVAYATSNRRHLVREFFNERDQDVNGLDTLQEKLSLSDRFGLTVLFLSPDQELYLKIVEVLARQKGIDMPQSHLRVQALEWERWNNGRSGRTARQFVEHLLARKLNHNP